MSPRGVYERPSLLERLMAHIDISGDCWEWTGARNAAGYGITSVGGWALAHRTVYELAFSPIPEGLFVCHHCDNPSCVRPSHLFLGKAADNTADMISKGRAAPHATGEAHHWARLTWAIIREMRTRHGAGEGVTALSRAYGINVGHMSRILAGRIWREEAA